MDNDFIDKALSLRKAENSFRTLRNASGITDLCSNDYLGFSRSNELAERTEEEFKQFSAANGATGSRLISGNTDYAEKLEKELAGFFNTEASLIFNSGYDANLGLFSSIAKRGDVILSDELVHASIIDGIRLSRADYLRFKHNDLAHLEERLEHVSKHASKNYQNIFVAVESVYSMDGDEAPLEQIAELCERYKARLVVDEAHATGVFGKNGAGMVSEYGLEKKVFARVHTFGKAMGCHGAVVAGSAKLRDYLINFSRPFIYSTALPLHSLCAIRMAFKLVAERKEAIEKLHALIVIFNKRMSELSGLNRIISRSAIHCILVPGNEEVKALAGAIQKRGFDVRPILHPTVPKGKERIRICLHSFNTAEEIMGLVESLIG